MCFIYFTTIEKKSLVSQLIVLTGCVYVCACCMYKWPYYMTVVGAKLGFLVDALFIDLEVETVRGFNLFVFTRSKLTYFSILFHYWYIQSLIAIWKVKTVIFCKSFFHSVCLLLIWKKKCRDTEEAYTVQTATVFFFSAP